MSNQLFTALKKNWNVSDWSVPVLYLILPFMIMAPGVIWKSHHIFFILCTPLIVAWSIRNAWVRAFIVYAVGWQLFLSWKKFSDPSANPSDGIIEIIQLASGAVIYKYVSESKLSNSTFFSVIRISAILQIAVSIFQWFGLNPVIWVLSMFVKTRELMPGDFVGTIGNRNFLTAFLAVSIPMFFGWGVIKIDLSLPERGGRRGKQKHAPRQYLPINIFLIIIAVILFLSPSPACLAALIGMAIYINKGWKYFAIAAIGAVLFAAWYIVGTGAHLDEFKALPVQLSEFLRTGDVTVNPNQHDLGRFGMWLVALGKIFSSWHACLLGSGPAAFYGRKYPLHNEYVAIWFEFGLVGLALMVSYIVTTVKAAIHSHNRLLLTSFAIACLDMTGNSSFHIAPTAFLAIIVAALIERERLATIPNQIANR